MHGISRGCWCVGSLRIFSSCGQALAPWKPRARRSVSGCPINSGPSTHLTASPPLTIRDADDGRRTFNLLDRDGWIDAYAWLLRNGDKTQPFTHLDAALLVDAWANAAPGLTPDLRPLRHPLVYAAGEAAIDQLVIGGLQAGRPAVPSRRA